MVKKLIKHDILFYLKSLLPAELLLLGMAVLVRVVQFFETDTYQYDIVAGSSIIIYVIAALVCFVMTFTTSVTRFYKNLYTAEGYLTLTLPASHTAHIFSKLITATAATFISLVVISASVLIATFGELSNEILKAAAYIFKKVFDEVGFHGVIYIVEMIILSVVSTASGFLLYYTCITVGQIFKKNRVAAAFGVYFAYYTFNQILGTVFLMIAEMFDEELEKLMEHVVKFVYAHPHAAVHIFLCGMIVLTVAVSAIYFLINRYIMKNRLNLE